MKVDLTKFTETHEFHFDEVFGHKCSTRDVRGCGARWGGWLCLCLCALSRRP